jgi:hypothetical protein
MAILWKRPSILPMCNNDSIVSSFELQKKIFCSQLVAYSIETSRACISETQSRHLDILHQFAYRTSPVAYRTSPVAS